MSFWEIFRKLLPFSGNEPSDWIITIAVIILWMVLISNILRGWIEYKNKSKKIKNFKHTIDEINTVDEISFDEDEKLQNSWKYFQKNLIEVSENDQKNTYRIYDASQFFTLNTVFKRIGSAQFSNTSSLLLSIGLLGTFIGLFYGLVQLNLDDAEKLQASMNQLIRASGAKFASSIWGLGLSIFFGIYERWLTQKAKNSLIELQDAINELYLSAFSEQNLLNLESIGTQNKKLLNDLNVTASTHNETSQSGFVLLKNQLEQNHNESQKFLNGIYQVLRKEHEENNDFHKQSLALFQDIKKNQEETNEQLLRHLEEISQSNTSLLENNQEQLERLKEQIEVLNGLAMDIAEELPRLMTNAVSESMDSLVKHIGGSEDNTLHDAIISGTGANFSEKLDKVLQDFMVEVKKSTGSDVENINKTIGNISSITQTLNDDISNLTEQMTKLLNNIQEKIDDQATKNGEASNSIKISAENAGDEIKNALSPISTTLKEFNDLVSQAKNHLQIIPDYLEQFETATGNLKDSANNTLSASDRLQESSIKLASTSNQLTTTMDDFNKGLDNITDKLKVIPTELHGILKMIEQVSNNANSTYLELSSQHKQLLTTNQQLMTHWIKGLEDYQDKTDDFVKQILSDMEQHIKQVLQEAKKDLNDYKSKSDEHIQTNLAKYEEMIQVFIKKADGLINTTFANFDGSLSKFASELAGAIEELNGAIEILNQKLQGR
ncbi:hypothetical protein [Moraxella nonliquefaciens]|uniref:MotA/TolQ/ExbB proton channel domain-containing protein n=1 Tax=Moraxella nonliquefaciens TaxID=478 RepID=A0A1B8QT52_MORNO|nr:hypothetical protein [Moraxella nonliquefaciens]OBX88318.1 hypothetical protein A7456_00165 [Moraxella nonliquefaciens]QPT44629.1 hypothetical protein I6G26_00800 [Moraxella nonliquefaciens]QQC29649.1 hypothetical protein I6H63_10260 [Moraxella nonliquefaciens]